MPSVLVHAPDDPVTLSPQAVKRLLDRGDGDAALRQQRAADGGEKSAAA